MRVVLNCGSYDEQVGIVEDFVKRTPKISKQYHKQEGVKINLIADIIVRSSLVSRFCIQLFALATSCRDSCRPRMPDIIIVSPPPPPSLLRPACFGSGRAA